MCVCICVCVCVQVEKVFHRCLKSSIGVRSCCVEGLRYLLIVPLWLPSAGKSSSGVLHSLYIDNLVEISGDYSLLLGKVWVRVVTAYCWVRCG